MPRWDWHVNLPDKKFKKEIFNSDDEKYWGSGNVKNPDIRFEMINEDENNYNLIINLPPMAVIVLK